MDRSRIAGWRPPMVWRLLQLAARVVVAAVCRLRVTGDVPEELRRGPLIVVVNHIGVFDPIAFIAACRVRRLAPRMMAAGGLLDAPVVGPVLRAAGLIRVDRRSSAPSAALEYATRALAAGAVIAVYPEGRIGLDPGLWPERGKTGAARLALDTRVAVVPAAQWGAHEVMAWHGRGAMAATLCRSLWRRPHVRVHFGAPIDLSDLATAPDAVARATERIINAITVELAPLRKDEPRLPRYVDPTRPVSSTRHNSPG